MMRNRTVSIFSVVISLGLSLSAPSFAVDQNPLISGGVVVVRDANSVVKQKLENTPEKPASNSPRVSIVQELGLRMQNTANSLMGHNAGSPASELLSKPTYGAFASVLPAADLGVTSSNSFNPFGSYLNFPFKTGVSGSTSFEDHYVEISPDYSNWSHDFKVPLFARLDSALVAVQFELEARTLSNFGYENLGNGNAGYVAQLVSSVSAAIPVGAMTTASLSAEMDTYRSDERATYDHNIDSDGPSGITVFADSKNSNTIVVTEPNAVASFVASTPLITPLATKNIPAIASALFMGNFYGGSLYFSIATRVGAILRVRYVFQKIR